MIDIVHIFGTTAFYDAADDSFAGRDFHVPDLLGVIALGDNGAVDRRIAAFPVLQQENRTVIGREQLLGVVRDTVHHGGQIERRRDIAADLGQRGALAGAPLVILEQPRVLESHTHARSHGGKQPDLGFAERVLALEIRHGEDT